MNDVSVRSGAASPRPPLAELALERGEHLPRDHPRQAQDAIALAARAREMVASGSASPIEALGFWDHPVRTAPIGAHRLEIDASASYRLA